MAPLSTDIAARERLLIAGAQLLDQAQGGDVSTRAILQVAGVQAPTLYHHFGNKEGLLDEVVSHGFRQYLTRRQQTDESADPVALVREGWDTHVRFGIEHPAFYSYIYSRVEKGRQCGVVSEVQAMILRTLEPAARAGGLKVPADVAAREILAASTGVIASMISSPAPEAEWTLSTRVRDAILDSVAADADSEAGADEPVAHAARVLAVAVDAGAGAFSSAEAALLKDWLARFQAHAL